VIFWQHYTHVVFYSPTILINVHSICVCARVLAYVCVLVQGCTDFPKVWESPQNSRCH